MHAYLIASTLVFGFLAMIWNGRSSWFNGLSKFVLIVLTVIGLLACLGKL